MKDQATCRRQLPQLVIKVNWESCNGTFSIYAAS
jgi:hypothetical protein